MADENLKNQSKTVLISRLPKDITKRELEDHFSDVGPIKKTFLIRDKHGQLQGNAYLTYSQVEDATKAVQDLHNSHIRDQNVAVKFSKQREREPRERRDFSPQDGLEQTSSSANNETEEETAAKRQEWQKWKQRRLRQKMPNRAGRIVIRNLSFKADDESVRAHFAPYGEITEVTLLKKPNGRLVGCAFVQFTCKTNAMNAIKECSAKPLLGREIFVDLALPKTKYSDSSPKIKEEPHDVDETLNEDFITLDTDGVKEEFPEAKDDSGVGEEDEEEEDDDDDWDETQKSSPSKVDEKPKPVIKEVSKDVEEGRTLFIRNVPFSSTQEDLHDLLTAFGELRYALPCIDKLTEHPKGTAFCQFKSKEAADACLKASEDVSEQEAFMLNGRRLHVMRAISRGDISKKQQERQKEKEESKDSRNLYLAREGLIRQGTLAAASVSQQDINMRMERERVKKRMLANYQIFVSRNRLCVHNLPLSLSDAALKSIVHKNSPDGAKITETRIMRDKIDVDDKGVPRSRGYAFVTLDTHESALAALRAINNNPNIFTAEKRPIVEFSLENKVALQAREQRLQKSKDNNMADGQQSKANVEANQSNKKPEKGKKRKFDSEKLDTFADEPSEKETQSFQGTKSKLGENRLPTHLGPKVRHTPRPGAAASAGKAKITRNALRRERKDRAAGKHRKRPAPQEEDQQQPIKKKMKMQIDGVKAKKGSRRGKKEMSTEDAKFELMVKSYKQKMMPAGDGVGVKKKKSKRWFE